MTGLENCPVRASPYALVRPSPRTFLAVTRSKTAGRSPISAIVRPRVTTMSPCGTAASRDGCPHVHPHASCSGRALGGDRGPDPLLATLGQQVGQPPGGGLVASISLCAQPVHVAGLGQLI